MDPDINTETADCPVCTERFDEKIHIPKRLSCPHTVCIICAKELAKKKNRIKCPLCGAEQSCARADKLPTDLASIQTARVLQLISCSDCSKINGEVTKCPNCASRACPKCIKYHKSSAHCQVMSKCRELTQIVNDNKVFRAKKIKSVISGRKRGVSYLKNDVETSFQQLSKKMIDKKTKILTKVSELEQTMNSVEAVLTAAKSVEQSKAMLAKDNVDVQQVKLRCEHLLSLVKMDLDKFDTDQFETKMDVARVMADIGELSLGSFSEADDEKTKSDEASKAESDHPDIAAQYWYRGSSFRELFPISSHVSEIDLLPTSGQLCVMSSRDSGHASVHLFDAEQGRSLRSFPVNGLMCINHLTVISDELVAVSSHEQNFVRIIETQQGTPIRQFGSHGKSGQKLSGPLGLCHDNGYIYVADYQNHRVSIWTVDGQFWTHYHHKKLKHPTNVAMNSQKQLAVISSADIELVVFDADGDYLTSVSVVSDYHLPAEPRPYFDLNDNLVVAGTEALYYDAKVIIEVFDKTFTHAIKIKTKIEGGEDFDVNGLCITKTGELIIAAYGQLTGKVYVI